MAKKYKAHQDFELVPLDFSITLSSTDKLAMSAYAEVFKDLESVFKTVSQEVTGRVPGNSKKKDALLVVSDFRTGSLEILADPYFQGIVSGLTASAIASLFKYVLRRVNGRPTNGDDLPPIPPEVISPDKLKAAAQAAVNRTSNARKRLKAQRATLGLKISITLEGSKEDVVE